MSTPENPPAAHDAETGRPGDPNTMVIFGAAGDLTTRKLVPALYNLARGNLLPQDFALVGFAVDDLTDETFRAKVRQDLNEYAESPEQCAVCDWLIARIFYIKGDFRDAGAYQRLRELLERLDNDFHTHGNHFYYLATAPSFFAEIVKQLGDAGLTTEENGQWRRVVIEKPFGSDLDSAKTLNRDIGKVLKEQQIYRIDHYLGKETVQKELLFLPFLNRILGADLEPPLHRPCADYGGREPRRRAARWLLRPCRSATRHGAEPYSAADQPDRHGAAHLLQGRCRAR